MHLLHIEIVLKKKQPEAETSLVYYVAHSGYQKRAQAERVTREKEMQCKDVLRVICGLMKQG